MPYRVDLDEASAEAFDRLIELGALDVDGDGDGGTLSAILPDEVDAGRVVQLFGRGVRIGPAQGRDENSVWVVRPRSIRLGHLTILPADAPPQHGAIRMVDGASFGTGLHPTSRLCLDILDAEIASGHPQSLLDVGTGSGILAMAALHAGVGCAVALDIDANAVRAAVVNARLNRLSSRLRVVQGGPEAVSGAWPLVVANVLAAPLMAMAPTLVRRVARAGRLVLSGVRTSLAVDVEQAYTRCGMRPVTTTARDGWTALTLQATW